MVEPIADCLNSIYHPLRGKEFVATYRIANYSMPQTENYRSVLQIEEQHPFVAVVEKTLSDVLELQKRYGIRVWTGITGPEISPRFTEYWMWVEPLCIEELEEGSSNKFWVQQCTVFEGTLGIYSHGVSIRVALVSLPAKQK